MSTISDKIISAGIELGEQIAGNVSNWHAQEQTMRDLIAAALTDARREGAEQMRAESAKLARALPLYYGSGDDGADESLAQAIEDLPLPAGPRQASRGYEVGAGTDAARRTEMITREQLELAALAAGHTIGWGEETPCQPHAAYIWNADGKTSRWWRPHLDDGDAARLADKLLMYVDSRGTAAQARVVDGPWYRVERNESANAWCEAVVLCAAAVGERMQKGGA